MKAVKKVEVKDTRTSMERVQDTCFEDLIRVYTERRDWDTLIEVQRVYGKVLHDRGLVPDEPDGEPVSGT